MSGYTFGARSDALGSVKKIDLPDVHVKADVAAVQAQKRYYCLSAVRLVALLVAAVTGAFNYFEFNSDFFRVILLLAFCMAALCEILLMVFRPERNWYTDRAIAESTKTLAWRFAVQGNPFGPNLTCGEAESLLRQRINEILIQYKDRLDFGVETVSATESMRNLRRSDFQCRRATYVTFRTMDQQKFYSDNARSNGIRATIWRSVLLAGEILAVVAAALAVGQRHSFDVAGLVATFIVSGAAWLAIKQYAQITSAYRVAATELTIQKSILETTDEGKWPSTVADAEEAISREHTMWLASRGEEPLEGS